MASRFLRSTALLTALLAAGAAAAVPRPTDRTALSPVQETLLSASAGKVLVHISAARLDLHRHHPDAARSELDQAGRLLDLMTDLLPTTLVKDRIQVAENHLGYETPKQVLPDLVPVYTRLYDIVDLVPTAEARRDIDKARADLRAGKGQAARDELAAADGALVYTEVELPIDATRRHLHAARTDLAAHRPAAADHALQRAEADVVTLDIDEDSPLTRADASLAQAVHHYANGASKAAHTDLQRAIADLDAADTGTRTGLHQATTGLHADAQRLLGTLDQHAARTGTELNALWERSRALAAASVEYLPMGWHGDQRELHTRSLLIQAQLHLRYARVDEVTLGDPAAARTDLAAAQRDLATARGAAPTSFMPLLDGLRDALGRLQSAPAAGDPATRYALVGARFRHAIGLL